MTKNSILLLTITLLLAACGQRSSENLNLNLDEVEIAKIQISPETMMDIIENLASPMEAAVLISSLNIPFSASNLPNPENLSTNTNPLEMAYRLGMLYTDLGYINLYENTGIAERFLTSIDQLTTELHIGQFFDLVTVKRLATSSSIDSLLYISINSFNYMGNSLRESDRGDQGALMITGAWIEGLYLATQAAIRNDSEHLKAMIVDQKLILNDLLLVLNFYNSETQVQNYITELESIMGIYDGVKINYEVGDPETVEKDGMLELVQPETSQLFMSDEVLDEITKITAEVRNAHLSSAQVTMKTQAK